MRKQFVLLLPALLILCLSLTVEAQQTAFTFQGKLTTNGSPANGNYDLQFALFDTASAGAQIGQNQTLNNVSVSGGVFTVTLNFGANAFPGAARFLEISTRPSGGGAFTLLTPRQQISSTPYAVTATNAQQLGGVGAGQYVKTDDTRLSDQRDPKTGSSNYLQNSTSPQASTNFNISGNGTAAGTLSGNAVNAATQYNLGGQKVLSLEGFRFPDGSVQSSAANPVIGKVYTVGGNYGELEIVHSADAAPVLTLTLPQGVYLVTATVTFENRANVFLQDNNRVARCYLNNEFVWVNGLSAYGSTMAWTTMTVHTVLTQSATGQVALKCGNLEDAGQVYARTRRLTAIRVADNPQ